MLYALVGGSDRHNMIALNLASALSVHPPDLCQVFEQTTKLKIVQQEAKVFYCSDVMVACSETDRAPNWREMPVLTVGALSPSTERIDRNGKVSAYTALQSLTEYALISTESPVVELMRQRNVWRIEVFTPGQTIDFESVGMQMIVDKLYRRVTF